MNNPRQQNDAISIAEKSPPALHGEPQVVGSPPRRKRTLDKGSLWIFVTKWVAGVLAAAASIVFGIWAPLSYKATAEGNRQNNQVQSSMLSSMASATSIASQAMRSATSIASEAMSSASAQQDRLAAMGRLALIDFCATQTEVFPCSSLLERIDFLSLATYLAGPITSTTRRATFTYQDSDSTSASTSSSRSSITATNEASPPQSGNGDDEFSEIASSSEFPVAAILGIVFGVIGIGGLILGVLVWRWRRNEKLVENVD